uniref:Uncharacterized protein n=1 Tax=Amphimedon queenslandica TaxID=400682 RepID=A0A1X7TKA1_AMPQE
MIKTSAHQLGQDERMTHFSCTNKLDQVRMTYL